MVKEIGELVRAQIRSVELKFGNKNDASLVKVSRLSLSFRINEERHLGWRLTCETIQCIILVGGLGQSKYLKEYITKEFSKFQIIQPEFS